MFTNSLTRCALIALALMAGFHVLVVALVSGLLWIAYSVVTYSSGAHGAIVLSFMAAASVLWAMLPRPDRFLPPGPRILKHEEPALFSLLEEVARQTGQDVPGEVYMVGDVTAFVSSRGGIMGFGSRRVMGLGLPLMQAVTVQEFKAVLAHEFGHYQRGDVAFGPWIHKTRMAIGRSVQQLRRHALGFIFVWYGRIFIRVTGAIARCQELVADAVAARAAGAGVMISGLRTAHAMSSAYQSYVQQELAPVIEHGYLPPVGAGFARFLQTPGMRAFLGAVVQYEEAQDTADPLDPHPPLKDRIAALQSLPQGSAGDTRRASSFLTDVAQWERLVYDGARELEPLDWNRVVHTVYMPMWRAKVDCHGHLLRGCTIGRLPATSAAFVTLGSMLMRDDDEVVNDRVRFDRAGQLVLAAVVVRLAALGWSVEALPGDETILRRDGHELRPYSELRAVLDGRTPASQWRDRCSALGIADVPLWGRASSDSSSGA